MHVKISIFMMIAMLWAAGCGPGSSEGTNNGAANNGGANNGTANNGTANNGTANNGTANNGSANNGVVTTTYHADVRPILEGRCVGCHVQGGIGPFPLTSYEDASDVGQLIKTVVDTRVMPPFLASNECRDYKHDPSLTDDQIDTINTWVDEGAAEGDPDDFEGAIDPIVVEMSRIDETLEMPEPYTPTKTPDDYRCFVLDWPYQETKYITGFGVDPGNDKVVHHVIAFQAPPNLAQKAAEKDAAEAGPGYTCFGATGLEEGSDFAPWLGSWAPGGVGSDYPQGTGLEIEPGSKIIMQVHYNTLVEEPEPATSSLHFKLDDTVDKTAIWMPWLNPSWLSGSMNIPAGESDATHSFSWDPTGFVDPAGPFHIWMGGLHMHLLGTSAKTWIERDDGEEDCLIDIPNWDFNWQSGVQFADPVRVNAGDQLALECHWDNSQANQPIVDGDQLQPADRNWGDGSTDEMCLGLYYITPAD